MSTKQAVDWTIKPRGTHFAKLGGYELEVFEISGQGWRWNVWRDGRGVAHGFGDASDAAKAESISCASCLNRIPGTANL